MIVTMILTGAFFVVSPSPSTAEQAGDYTYSINDGSAVISAYTGAGGAVTIPSSLGGYTVTGIGAYAFNNAAGFSVRSLIIPDSVTSIDIYAFDGCTALTSLTLGSSLLTIGNGAFERCSGLISVTIPNSVTRIGSWAFYSCTSLSTLTLGSGVVNIGDYAFDGCSALVSLTIPNNVVSVGTSAFEGCSALTSVSISNRVQTIGSFAFYDCKALMTVTMGSGVTSVGSSMFYGCDLLTSITFLGLVAPTSVGSYWLPLNSYIIRGHAYATSNFPAPGNTYYGLMMESTIDPVVPEAPNGLSAAPADAGMVLTWSAPSSSGGGSIIDYKMYRGTASAGESYIGHTGSGSALTYTDTGLTNGATYYYQVTAVNAYGEGPGSNEISGKPSVALSAPRDLQITAGDSQASLTWTMPSTIGDYPIDYYIVYQDGVDVRHPTGTTSIITGLNNGQPYIFAVAAHNSVGVGPQTAATPTTPVTSKTVPGAPTGLVATPGNAQVALSWSAPVSNGGATIDYYLVLVDGVAKTAHYSTTTATVSGLTNGHQYSFTVTAHNVIGTSLQSAAVKSTPTAPVTVPTAPRDLTTMPGDGQVSLTWSAPSSNGGAAIDYYLVYVDGVVRTDHYPASSAIITGLTNAKSYSFTVAAHNSVGVSSQSSAIIAKPAATITVPGVPVGPNSVPGDGQIALTWSAPSSNGGANIDYYLVYTDGVVGTDHYTTTSATITGLTNGQTYSFTIVAHNSVGTGAQSAAVKAKPSTSTTVPGVPIGLTAMPGDGQVELSWSAPGSNGGAAIDYYLVYVDGVARTDHYPTSYVTLTDLANGRSYTFAVSAHNIIGDGIRSSAVTSTPSVTLTVPGVPTGLVAVPGDGQVSLSWTIPSGNGGSVIDYYVIYRNGSDVSHVTSTSETVTDLMNGQMYGFTVAAHNAIGMGAQSSSVTAMASATTAVPGAPFGLTATPGDGQIVLSWSSPGSNGGATIDYYVIYINGTQMADHFVDNVEVISGLINGLQYNFTVAAHNSVGIGPQSSVLSAMPSPTITVPGIPGGLNVTLVKDLVSLSWDPPSVNGGDAIDYYVIFQDGVDAYHETATSKMIVGLTNGRLYNFTVAAHNSVGVGQSSTMVNATLHWSPALPDVPSNVTVVPGDGLVTITWSDPDSPGSSPIDYYVVYQDGVEVAHLIGNVTTITGLTNGLTYDFVVAAHNSEGMGENSTAITVTLTSRAEPPGTTMGLTVTPGNSSLMISWTAPQYSGSFEIDYYVVYQDGVDVLHVIDNQTTIGGLNNGQNYTIEVGAHNAAGVSNRSIALTVSPMGPNSTNTETSSPTKQDNSSSNVILNVGAVLLLMAAIFGIVLAVERLKKKA
ncbi:MAG TPA: fibronectin type III domain-containing protein [Methanomassiliicoccales archaeon]